MSDKLQFVVPAEIKFPIRVRSKHWSLEQWCNNCDKLKFVGHRHVIVIGNGKKQSTKTIKVTTPMISRARPRGSIVSGCGWRTRSITARSTMKTNQAGLPCHIHPKTEIATTATNMPRPIQK